MSQKSRGVGGQPPRESQPPRPGRFPLPEDTALALTGHRHECANLGLWLDRYADWEEQGGRGLDRAMAFKKRRAPMLRRDAEGVGELGGASAALIEACRKRCEGQRQSLKSQGYHVADSLVAAPDYRLVVGFGAEHVLETSLCLHRIYGFPLIPGSSVKGVARARAFWELAEKLGASDVPPAGEGRSGQEEKTPLQILDQLLSEGTPKGQEATLKKLKGHPSCREIEMLRSLDFEKWSALARDFYAIFGTTERRGGAVFFDAYPLNPPRLVTDVLNPHYSKYYGGGAVPPANYHEPIPTYFLTVAPGSRFRFAVASKDQRLLSLAEGWLRGALEELGVGAKTASGYGLMTVEGAPRGEELTAPVGQGDADRRRADEIIKGVGALHTPEVAGRIYGFYEKWRDAELSPAQKSRVAAAIVAKVRDAKREKASSEKAWYKELLESAEPAGGEGTEGEA